MYAINTTRKDFYVLFDQSVVTPFCQWYQPPLSLKHPCSQHFLVFLHFHFPSFFIARILRWISDSGCAHLTDEETVCYSTAQGCREILHRSPACLLNWFRNFVKMYELSFFAVTLNETTLIPQMMCPLKFYQATDVFVCMLCILCIINGWIWQFLYYIKICVNSINVFFFFPKLGIKRWYKNI